MRGGVNPLCAPAHHRRPSTRQGGGAGPRQAPTRAGGPPGANDRGRRLRQQRRIAAHEQERWRPRAQMLPKLRGVVRLLYRQRLAAGSGHLGQQVGGPSQMSVTTPRNQRRDSLKTGGERMRLSARVHVQKRRQGHIGRACGCPGVVKRHRAHAGCQR